MKYNLLELKTGSSMTRDMAVEYTGTLVLYKATNNHWYRAKLLHVFLLPSGLPETKTCCLIQSPKGKFIIYLNQIYYAFPHFNKKIREFHQKSINTKQYGYASAAK